MAPVRLDLTRGTRGRSSVGRAGRVGSVGTATGVSRAGSVAKAAVALLACLLVEAAVAFPADASGADTAGPDVPIGVAPLRPAAAVASAAPAGDTPVDFDVVLPPRDPAALDAFVAAVSTPGNPLYRKYLPPGAFGPRFGAAPSTIASVTAALRDRGLTVGTPSRNGLSIPVSGTVAEVSSALRTSFTQYRLASGKVGLVNTAPPQLPANVASQVAGFVGLNQLTAAAHTARGARTQATPARRDAPGPGGSSSSGQVLAAATAPTACTAASDAATATDAYLPAQIAHHYGLDTLYPTTTGAGVTIALFELEPFDPADIAAYQACFGTSATVNVIKVDGGAGVGGGTGEAALDIETIIGLAPQANIVVYEAPNDGASVYDQFRRIANDATAHVISDSWGLCEAESGVPQLAALERPIFQQMAAQGQTMLAATGDAGSAGCYAPPTSTTTALSVWEPASQPEVTAVGGTTLPTADGADISWATTLGASGGGISTLWQMPAYQRARATILESTSAPCGAQSGQLCREVPDISALADIEHGSLAYYNGHWQAVGGTSVATPITASLIGLIDSTCAGGPVGLINPALYQLGATPAAIVDVATGPDNDFPNTNGGQYATRAGYDLTTGLGRPNTAGLATGLCPPVAAPGAGTMTVDPTLSSTSTIVTLTFTYKPAPGTGLVDGELEITIPGTWTLPTTTSTSPGYTTSSAGTVSIVGNTIVVRGITAAADQPVRIVYGDTSGGAIGVQTPSTPQATVFAALSRPGKTGSPAAIAINPAVRVLAPGGPGPGQAMLVRTAGADRIGTSIAASKASFPMDNSAQAIVLARSDTFPDALAGVPLAAHVHGPLLLTNRDALPPALVVEIQRVLPIGGPVFVLGGTAALSPSIDMQLSGLGYAPVRIQGPTRFDTAVKIANALGDPTAIFEADGQNFPDALSAGPAAVITHGAVLLTDGDNAAPATAAYLAAHPGDIKYAIGGPAAAADPTATPLVGAGRYETSTMVAKRFFTSPSAVGVASGVTFPDALSGGPVAAQAGGPLVLVPADGPLPVPTQSYLSSVADSVLSAWAFGGTAALSTLVANEVAQSLVLVPPPS